MGRPPIAILVADGRGTSGILPSRAGADLVPETSVSTNLYKGDHFYALLQDSNWEELQSYEAGIRDQGAEEKEDMPTPDSTDPAVTKNIVESYLRDPGVVSLLQTELPVNVVCQHVAFNGAPGGSSASLQFNAGQGATEARTPYPPLFFG